LRKKDLWKADGSTSTGKVNRGDERKKKALSGSGRILIQRGWLGNQCRETTLAWRADRYTGGKKLAEGEKGCHTGTEELLDRENNGFDQPGNG